MSRAESLALALRLVGGLPPDVCKNALERLEYLERVRRCCWCGEWSTEFSGCSSACAWCAKICLACTPAALRCAGCDSYCCDGWWDWFEEKGMESCTCGEWITCRARLCGVRLCSCCASEGACATCDTVFCPKHVHAEGECQTDP